ncbi:MAG TPA: magnesium/cobalt transporter CorA, partial [Gemmatimonadales bacterium]|nr:magnesium/cobalt transporter CorA [Gemmatimonadales bacterium]
AGLAPGSLVHVGEERAQQVSIRVMEYAEGGLLAERPVQPERLAALADAATVTWFDVDGVHRVDIVERLGAAFGIHPLLLEDILNPQQRPKVEDYGSYVCVVLNMLSVRDGAVEREQVSVVFGQRWLITFQEGKAGDAFDMVRQWIRDNRGRICRLGPDYLAYALIDAIVDRYFAVVEHLGDQMDHLEEGMLTGADRGLLSRLHRLRSELLNLRRMVWPLREVVAGLQRGGMPLIQDATQPYLRDVHDHTIQIVDALDAYRDMSAGMLEIYLTNVSNRLNEVMKVLTIIATIFIPLTFIVGIYGMNFDVMPELRWRWGYPVVMLGMAGLAGGMLWFFRRKQWW